MWGLIPAAGAGSRIQPLAFSKELLPVGSRLQGGVERPRAVSEYLVERMITAGATQICFVIGPGKSDILAYYGASVGTVPVCYTVQDRSAGLCDALFCAVPFMAEHDHVVIGLPDTVWFPADGFRRLPDHELSLLLFPVDRPELFDAVVTDPTGAVQAVEVKQSRPSSSWIWGGLKMPVSIFRSLHALWLARGREDTYLGTLLNAHVARGGRARSVAVGQAYVDVGTLHGYRQAIGLLSAVQRDFDVDAERATDDHDTPGAADWSGGDPGLPKSL